MRYHLTWKAFHDHWIFFLRSQVIACMTFVTRTKVWQKVVSWVCVAIDYMKKRKSSGKEGKGKQQYEYSGKN